MKEGGGTYATDSTTYSGGTVDPTLDEGRGNHNDDNWHAEWTTFMPNGLVHLVDQFILQKRWDNKYHERVITKVRFQYVDVDGNW